MRPLGLLDQDPKQKLWTEIREASKFPVQLLVLDKARRTGN